MPTLIIKNTQINSMNSFSSNVNYNTIIFNNKFFNTQNVFFMWGPFQHDVTKEPWPKFLVLRFYPEEISGMYPFSGLIIAYNWFWLVKPNNLKTFWSVLSGRLQILQFVLTLLTNSGFLCKHILISALNKLRFRAAWLLITLHILSCFKPVF